MEILQATTQADQVAVDETGWRLGGQPAWLQAWVSELATWYHIARSRSADALEKVIGTLVHNGFACSDGYLARQRTAALGSSAACAVTEDTPSSLWTRANCLMAASKRL